MLSLNNKHVQHCKICLPCNFEVNPVTDFGVISLFSSNYQHFNTFRPLFQKLLVLKCWKFDEKREITPKWVTGFTSKLYGRQILTCWTCLQLVISLFSSNFQHFNTFPPLFQKLLEINVKFKLQTCSACDDLPTKIWWKKGNNSKMGYGIYFKIAW
jgi:hypothetical protein